MSAPDDVVESLARHWMEFIAQLHPLALHFPLALLMVGAAAVVWNWFRGEEGIGEFAFHCIWIGAAISLLAAVSGWFMAEGEEGEPGLELHRWFGVGSAAAAVVLTAMASLCRTDARPGLLGMTRALALLTAGGVAYAGHVGGEMKWGESELAGKFSTAMGATWDHYRERLARPVDGGAAVPGNAASPTPASSHPTHPAVVAPPALPAGTAASPRPGAVSGRWHEADEPPPTPSSKPADTPPSKPAVPDPVPPKKPVSWKETMLPLLKERCFECHSAEKPKDGVGFDHMEELIKKEGKRAVVMKGDPNRSTMFTTIMRGDDSKKRMPPPKSGPRLTPEQAGIIQAWIKEGARLDN